MKQKYVYWIGSTFALDVYRKGGERCKVVGLPCTHEIKHGFISLIVLG